MLECVKIKVVEIGLEVEFIEVDIRILELLDKYDFIFIFFNFIYYLYKNEDLF